MPRRDAAGCPQVSEPRTATPDGSGGSVRVSAAGSVAVRPGGEVATPGGHRPHRTSTQPKPSPSVVDTTGQLHRLPDTTVDASAAAPPSPMAVVRHGAGHRPAMRHRSRAPAIHSGQRTGRCPPAQRPADMPAEAAAERPQRFRPGGGNGTGCRTPDRSRSHPAWTPIRPPDDVAAQDRTPEAADGQSADRSDSL
jgi:hypothetical protein